MLEIVFGTIAFILFIAYDLEQVGTIPHSFHKMTKYFFMLGSAILVMVTAVLIWETVGFTNWSGKKILLLFLAMLFLVLLIYTLFFSLPFEETYVVQDAHKTYDRKMYALCRHPGVLWFAGFYICLWLVFGGKSLLVVAIWFSFLNFCYIILQDFYTFPRIFSDYEDYKKRVPFLIPSGKSLRRCFDTFKESR